MTRPRQASRPGLVLHPLHHFLHSLHLNFLLPASFTSLPLLAAASPISLLFLRCEKPSVLLHHPWVPYVFLSPLPLLSLFLPFLFLSSSFFRFSFRHLLDDHPVTDSFSSSPRFTIQLATDRYVSSSPCLSSLPYLPPYTSFKLFVVLDMLDKQACHYPPYFELRFCVHVHQHYISTSTYLPPPHSFLSWLSHSSIKQIRLSNQQSRHSRKTARSKTHSGLKHIVRPITTKSETRKETKFSRRPLQQ